MLEAGTNPVTEEKGVPLCKEVFLSETPWFHQANGEQKGGGRGAFLRAPWRSLLCSEAGCRSGQQLYGE